MYMGHTEITTLWCKRNIQNDQSFQHASSQRRCCHYWKRRGSTGRCQSTTGR